MKRLVLIDGHAVLYRAFHALPPLTSSNGQLVNAVYGFVLMLLKVYQDLKPDYLVVAFDLPIPTFRHETYIAYQATRPHMDDGLKGQIVLVKEVVESARIPIFTAPGFEADDVIATLARQCKGKSEVIIVTGDRDIFQLVDDGVKVYMLTRGMSEGRVFDKKQVKEYLGISPEQIVDYKALTGDSSDNYPGVPGIGPKTAVELLKEFGNLEKLYRNVEGVKENIKKKLKEGKESALMSQKLAQISARVPVELDLEKAKLADLKTNEKFIDKLKELGFKSLLARVRGVTDKDTDADKDKEGGQTSLF
ncbi:MAG: hypothetical protein A3D24_04075 [Candidatus Blackburnbacteria bacterium RIFCSPHIGHO2_02_FULL_39_13]|uniref:5'-3' exonuclease domain-containing protein n=1 Tax=Candidatus Blackburnbacteria bacterium RIFCSPLOWO2_01_FULL_40_20 TaxID=1797519 RepID=A0A1G1VAW2_9BACT|nr:MAG: polymerase protein [Microgenomates group bacterium GW2011_GWA2_39_19]OGY07322.1 MAG: hypothetical protein A2694_02650 [Candidatus Blackburnbacteria bacterium RIFCSPHIGHO2_01_FULL_40_17]OGY08408.1 MAG: hypothetical protein A3D24_04075 [Candidatus Blackburnbacteria bacterium RIFCSPHIGHO2_02_FULL_39_13]OGY12496.1 MAG: hypothetical protein A3A77_00785 [Candidatus Blackburnbacteria bacterium RIFCSPLOWO2_01_FULL_40_20]HBL52122.1 hypothetical protein [Candidatus Blackburnbacteria bacterium]